MFVFRAWASAVVATALIVSVMSAASATATVDIHHADGSDSVYSGTRVTIVGSTLHVRSADGQGSLVIERAACTRQRAILMCLPTRVSVRQHGTSHVLALESGTIYFNFTGAPHRLSFSTQHVQPHGVVLSLRTVHGTLINLDGTIDAGAAGQPVGQ